MTLDQLLADVREEAMQLERLGLDREAKLVRGVVARVADAAGPWLRFLPELEASLFSGMSPRQLQRRYLAWERRGLARKQGRTRCYCEAILPRRADTAAAYAAGRAAARLQQGAA